MQDSSKPSDMAMPELKENKSLFTVAIVVAAFAVLLFLGSMYMIARHGNAPRKTASTQSSASTTQSQETTAGTDYNADNIQVVKVTSVMHENGALTANGTIDPTKVQTTQASISSQTQVEPVAADNTAAENPVAEPESPAASQPVQIVGVDEDVAKANLEAQGYTVFSVYVCDANTLAGKSARPANGLVLAYTTYSGRVAGEKFAFINVATSSSYARRGVVPMMRGMTLAKARAALSAQALGARVIYEAKSPSPAGTVVFQAPSAGVSLPAGCTAVLVVAK